MSHEFEDQQPQELKVVERSLAALAPAPPRVDRDRLMFLAGAASGRREPPDGSESAEIQPIGKLTLAARLLWPATSAALAATSLALAIVLVSRPMPQAMIVYRDRPLPVVGTLSRAFPIAVDAPATAPHPAHVAAPQALASRPAPATIAADNYVRTRDVALRLGLDALGDWSGSGSESASPTPTYGSLLESLTPSGQRRSGATTESSQM